MRNGRMVPVPGSSVTTVRGELINIDQVRCALDNLHESKRAVEVSVSNDGSAEYSKYQLFIAYDPTCHHCIGYNCFTKTDVCSIGKTCIKNGAVSIYDDCKYCNLDNPTEWTIRTDLPHCKSVSEREEEEDKTLRTALIAACISLLVLVMILVAAVCFFRGKSSRQRSAAHGQPPAYDNPAYAREYFNGRPIPAYSNETGMGNNLTKTQFPESA